MMTIAEVQDEKEPNIDGKYDPASGFDTRRRESAAARTLQRTYRGH